MATLAPPLPSVRQPVRFTVAKFYRMARAGVLKGNVQPSNISEPLPDFANL